jgi:hypothetical protein
MKKGFLLILIFLAACAPKPDEAPEAKINFEFGPRFKDVQLDLSKLNEQTQASKENWKADPNTSAQEKLELYDNMYSLGTKLQNEKLTGAAISGIKKFRAQYQSQLVSFDNTPYVEAIVGSTQGEAVAEINKAQEFLKSDAEKLASFIDTTKSTLTVPADAPAAVSIQAIQSYVSMVVHVLPSLKLNPMVEEAVTLQLKTRTEGQLTKLSAELQKVEGSTTSFQALENIDNLSRVMEQVPSDDTQEKLVKGHNLAKKVLAANDAQDILSIIVDIHRMLDPKERESIIGAENRDLYEFLRDSDETRLNCLAARKGCQDAIAWMGKKIKIFPAIEAIGVPQLKNKIDQAMKGYIFESLNAEIVKAALNVPDMIKSELDKGIEEKLNETSNIKNNFRGFVKNLARAWSVSKLPALKGQVRGLEQSELKAADSGAELIGLGLLVKTKILNEQSQKLSSEEQSEWALEHINKLLAIGGYKKHEADTTRPLTQSLDLKSSSAKMALQDILKSPLSFAVPDKITVVAGYSAKEEASTKMNVGVLGQARLLRGLAQSIRFLKDWQPTSFDKILGGHTVANVFAAAPKSLGDRKVFPKDTLFALAVGNSAVILKNLLKELSPVFVLVEENRIIWANKYKQDSADPSVMAGVVNLVGGVRDVKVSAKDLSEYILGLTEFYEATVGLEKTRSSALTVAQGESIKPVQELMEGREQIKLLVMALANFLSNKMKGSDGWIHEGFNLKSGVIEGQKYEIMTQFKALKAMMKAYQMTKLAPYSWTIYDLYFKLNNEAFDAKTGFYRGISKMSDGIEALETLRTLEPMLPGQSQIQVEKLINSWSVWATSRI